MDGSPALLRGGRSGQLARPDSNRRPATSIHPRHVDPRLMHDVTRDGPHDRDPFGQVGYATGPYSLPARRFSSEREHTVSWSAHAQRAEGVNVINQGSTPVSAVSLRSHNFLERHPSSHARSRSPTPPVQHHFGTPRPMSGVTTRHSRYSRDMRPYHQASGEEDVLPSGIFVDPSLLQDLLDNQNTLLGRVHSLEDIQRHELDMVPPGASSRGDPASLRGRNKRIRQRALRRAGRSGVAVTNENLGEMAVPPPEVGQEDLERGAGLSKVAKTARSRLQAETTRKFRSVCGVVGDDPWPDIGQERTNSTTGEVYRTPNFTGKVTHPDNVDIFRHVARLLWDEYQDPNNVPEELRDPHVYWTRSTIEEFAKTSFRSFKVKWQAQENERVERRLRSYKSSNRRLSRRQEKARHRAKVVETYREAHGADPKPLLYVEHMSDDASGPEDEGEEDHETWKARMARHMGIDPTKVPAEEYARMKFVENVSPEWRSRELTDIFHELHHAADAARPKKNIQKQTLFRVKGTGRSSDAPPATPPYDIGINKGWYERQRGLPGMALILVDWYNYPGPVGFETLQVATPDESTTEEHTVGGIGEASTSSLEEESQAT